MKLTTLLLAAGLSLLPARSKYVTDEEARKIHQGVGELKEMALRCGLRETKKAPWDQRPHDEYSLRAGSALFVFFDGDGYTKPNGKADPIEAHNIGTNSLWFSGSNNYELIRRMDRELGRALQEVINTLKNNLPNESF